MAELTPAPLVGTPAGGGVPGVAAPADGFAPGELFAGRFRMITWLGRSNSGEVWQAEDLVLQTPVALKIIGFATPEDRERILTEVRLARQITHPGVRRVFDVGEVDGKAFCSMELIDGDDLAVLLRRVGRFSPEKVLEIGVQLCDALAAGHAEGVLHRDVRPENILIDKHGLVRVTDFGVGAPPDGPGGQGAAASPYMAPEQRSQGGHFTEKTDLYALGVVLYELLVGHPPAGERRRLLKPSAVVPDIGEPLERVIVQALHGKPRRRPPSAAAMSAQLSGVAPPPVSRRMVPWLAGAALALIVAAAALGMAALSYGTGSGGASRLSDQDSIVIADFLNTTGEPVFDRALKVALVVALEQSPFLKVLPDDRIREALQLMQRAPGEPITRSVARDVARREGARALVSASVGRLGNNYVLSLEAVDAETGDVMARAQAEAVSKEDVLTSLGGAASRLRATLGDSMAQVEKFDAPLARATTPSLEALHVYSLALDQGRANPRAEAIPYLRRAIELDPNFAMAHAFLSGVYANTGRFADAPAHARTAFELRDRVSERERFFISWRYYLDASQAWDAALDLAESWTATYPREAFAFNSLGLASAAFGDHGRAVGAFREAIRLDPRFVPPHGNLAGSLIASGRCDEARRALDETARRGIDVTGTRRAAFLLSVLSREAPGSTVEAKPPAADAIWTVTWEARAAAAAGRFAAAHALYQRAVESALAGNLRDLAAQWSMEDAELHAVADRCDAARSRVAEGLERGRDNFTLERASRTLALCGDSQGVSRLSDELARRFPEATLTRGVQLPVTAAALSLRRRESARVLDLLAPVRPYDHAPSAEFWPKYLRGLASLQLKDGSAAAGQFQEIIAHRGEAPTSPLLALAQLGLARAAAMSGDRRAARSAYDSFLAAWAGADRDLSPLSEARREYARIRE